MSSSSFSGGSHAPLDDDRSKGIRGAIARLTPAVNPTGLVTATPSDAYYAGVTITNRSTSQYVRVELIFAPWATVAPGDIFFVVSPGQASSKSFQASVIKDVRVQSIATPPAGVMTDTSSMVPGIGAGFDVVVDLVNP